MRHGDILKMSMYQQVWNTVKQQAVLLQSSWRMHLARRCATALRERRAAARFRRFVPPPQAPVSVGEALSKLRKSGRGLGGLGRWFPGRIVDVVSNLTFANVSSAVVDTGKMRGH